MLPCDPTDFCGPPKTVPHASLILNKHYYVGQELHFKCQSGYDKRPPTSGTRWCKKVNGKIIWTHLDMRCTNDSSYSDEWPPQTMEPGKMVALASHRCHDLFMQGPDPPAQHINPRDQPAWGSGWRDQWPQGSDTDGDVISDWWRWHLWVGHSCILLCLGCPFILTPKLQEFVSR